MRLRWGVLAVGACAACCAPLVLPWLAGTGIFGGALLGGGLFALGLDQILCVGLALAVLAIFLVALIRRRRAVQVARCRCQGRCDLDHPARPKTQPEGP